MSKTNQSGTGRRAASQQQGLSMLVFESISFGGIAVFVVLIAVLVLVGIYSYFIWPFTHWDLASVADNSWWEYGLGVIFVAGSLMGLWVFSGAAFDKRARNTAVRSQN